MEERYDECFGSPSFLSPASTSSNSEYADTDSVEGSRNGSEIHRPCYYFLRALAIWQPKRCSLFFRFYNYLGYIICLSSLAMVVALSYVRNSSFPAIELMNNINTAIDVGFPFFFTKYYFHYGHYEAFLSHLTFSRSRGVTTIKRLSLIYTCISLTMWIIFAIFFAAHWWPFFSLRWHYVVYGITIFFMVGYWACWLSLYGYVCHLHRAHILMFKRQMKDCFQASSMRPEAERRVVATLLHEFNNVQHWLHQSQRDFSKIISFAVAYHIIDLIVYSIAYWRGNFGDHYPLWQYAGTCLYDALSIFIKLYPAAVVSLTLHKTMITSGDLCNPWNGVVPKERIELYNYIYFREKDMGLGILGIKITMRLTLALFVTLITAAATFLRIALEVKEEKHML